MKNILYLVLYLDTLKFVDKIIAVNDGSIDGSEKTIKDLENVNLLNLNLNYGKGKALQVGFDEFLKNDFDIIVTIDGDNQHDPKYIPDFVDKLKEFDIVIGNRLT